MTMSMNPMSALSVHHHARAWRWGLLLLLLACWAGGNAAPRLEMTPNDPLVRSGTTLELNCTLTDYPGPLNASAVYFQLGEKRIKSEYVDAVNNTTARMRYPNISKNSSHLSWFCYLNSTDVVMGGHQSVVVGDPPITPYNISCRVYNWENMTCRWLPKDQDKTTGLSTNQTLYWSIGDTKSICTVEVENTCTWYRYRYKGQNKLYMYLEYHLEVQASNRLGHLSGHHDVFTNQNIVEPNPPKNVKVGNVKKRSCALTWESPVLALYPVEYNITYRSKWGVEGQKTTRHKNISLVDLVPHTYYRIAIACMPLYNDAPTGYLSRSANTNCTTEQDVPAAAPQIVPFGFSTVNVANGNRNATIYWKQVPQNQSNGIERGYRIRVRESSGSNMTVRVPPKHLMTNNLTLKRNVSYRIYIDVMTIGFNDSLELVPLFIPEELRVPPKPGRFVSLAQNDDITLNWTAVESAIGYTIYWCRGTPNLRVCQANVEWEAVGGNVTNHTLRINKSDINEFIFAISAQYDGSWTKSRIERSTSPEPTLSSGFLWSDCTFFTDKGILSPEQLTVADGHESGSVTLEWQNPSCDQSGYIHEYRLNYCHKASCGEDERVVEVIDALQRSLTVEGLTPTYAYEFWMESTSPYSDRTPTTEHITHTVRSTDLAPGYIVLIFFAALFVFGFIILGIRTTWRKCKKNIDQKIPQIVMPPIQTSNGYRVEDEADDEAEGSLQTTQTVSLLSSGDCRLQENCHNQDIEYRQGGRQVARDHIYQNGRVVKQPATAVSPNGGAVGLQDTLSPLLGSESLVTDGGSTEAPVTRDDWQPGAAAGDICEPIASYNQVSLGELEDPDAKTRLPTAASGLAAQQGPSVNEALTNKLPPDLGYSQVTGLFYPTGYEPAPSRPDQSHVSNMNNANNKDDGLISSYSALAGYPDHNSGHSTAEPPVPNSAHPPVEQVPGFDYISVPNPPGVKQATLQPSSSVPGYVTNVPPDGTSGRSDTPRSESEAASVYSTPPSSVSTSVPQVGDRLTDSTSVPQVGDHLTDSTSVPRVGPTSTPSSGYVTNDNLPMLAHPPDQTQTQHRSSPSPKGYVTPESARLVDTVDCTPEGVNEMTPVPEVAGQCRVEAGGHVSDHPGTSTDMAYIHLNGVPPSTDANLTQSQSKGGSRVQLPYMWPTGRDMVQTIDGMAESHDVSET